MANIEFPTFDVLKKMKKHKAGGFVIIFKENANVSDEMKNTIYVNLYKIDDEDDAEFLINLVVIHELIHLIGDHNIPENKVMYMNALLMMENITGGFRLCSQKSNKYHENILWQYI